MKKTILASVLVTSLMVAGVASANWGRGGGGWGGCGYCPAGQGAGFGQQLDPALQQKYETFAAETRELQKELAIKQAERMALLRSDNPDPATVAKVTGELFDLRTSLQEKAAAAGINQLYGPRGGRGMMFDGGGRGRGPMMGGQRF